MFLNRENFCNNEYFGKYDYNLLEKLEYVWSNSEGSIFCSPNLDQQKIQLEFHKKVFSQLNPKNILEVGTHKANYSYFCKTEIPDIKIVTFGIDAPSEICVNMVQEYFSDDFIEFHCGDSKETLSEYESDIKFDLAWVDGGHSYDCAISDLNNCLRLGIENILIDDVTLLESVKNALNDFLTNNPQYTIIEESGDERNIVWISSSI